MFQLIGKFLINKNIVGLKCDETDDSIFVNLLLNSTFFNISSIDNLLRNVNGSIQAESSPLVNIAYKIIFNHTFKSDYYDIKSNDSIEFILNFKHFVYFFILFTLFNMNFILIENEQINEILSSSLIGPPNDIKILKLFPGGSSTGVDCELIYMLTKNYSKNIDLEIKYAINKSSSLIAKKIGTLMSYSGKNNKLISILYLY